MLMGRQQLRPRSHRSSQELAMETKIVMKSNLNPKHKLSTHISWAWIGMIKIVVSQSEKLLQRRS